MHDRISEDILAEQWFSFIHGMIAKLQVAFRKSGFSQKQVARMLGKQPAVVSRCLTGQQNMTVRTMHDIARAVGCRLEINLVPIRDLKPASRSQIGSSANTSIFGSDPFPQETAGALFSRVTYQVPNEEVRDVA